MYNVSEISQSCLTLITTRIATKSSRRAPRRLQIAVLSKYLMLYVLNTNLTIDAYRRPKPSATELRIVVRSQCD